MHRSTISRMPIAAAGLCAVALLAGQGGLVRAAGPAPRELVEPAGAHGEPRGLYSDRTLVVGVELDRDQARVLRFTVKPRPFVAPLHPAEVRPYAGLAQVQVEISLLGPHDARYTRRMDVGPLCFEHGAQDEAHVEGDTIRMHRDSFLVELPELEGFDRVELAYHEKIRGGVERRALGVSQLEAAAFRAAAGPARFEGLAFAPDLSEPPPEASPAASTVRWPEDVGETDLLRIYGDAAETNRRINIVIVPDGYTLADKALMETHADAMVAYFRGKTPHAEHDPFHNYILVYAYSLNSGTDQCDCDIVLDTAMGTRFPESNPSCGNSDNRCLSYGGGCDSSGTANIVEAELRAPAHDETVVMVNTTRYGGCGGLRATYAAGNGSALELAVHELGHSMSNLADEYFYNSSCGSFAGEINTSSNPVDGAWPEWTAEIGAPREGAQYWGTCLYRPESNCEMRSLGQPFCRVCNQRWSLWTYAHSRVGPTAPIAGSAPAGSVGALTHVPVDFSVATRLSLPPATHEIVWTLDGPGTGGPTPIASGTDALNWTFTDPGQYTLTCEVTADTNFVKPARFGANRDSVAWTVDVATLAPPGEVSAPGSPEPLRFVDTAGLAWQDASADNAFAYNLYRADVTLLPTGSYGDCLEANVAATSTSDPQTPPLGAAWFYLVTGRNPAGEGPAGLDSGGATRVVGQACN